MTATTAPAVVRPGPAGGTAATPRGLPRRTRRVLWVVLLGLVALVAFLVRLRLLTSVGGLDGSDGYDDGVYYAAADALVHGRLPYRDLLFLQPPGIVLVLAPFAWLGAVTRDPVGVVAARLFFEAIGAANAVLVTVLARRFGLIAAVTAGVGYAVLYPAAYAERSSLLEPLGTFGLLVALVLAERASGLPRAGMVLAGVAAGAAVGMKIWYVVPVAIIAAFHRRHLGRFGAGVAAGAGLIYLPFLLAAPAAMVREVVLDQLGRPEDATDTPWKRLVSLLGSPRLHLHQPLSALFSQNKIGLLLVLVVLACAVAALAVPGAHLYPALLGATAIVLLASPSYLVHYGALTAPWLVLTMGIGLGRLLKPITVRSVRGLLAAVVIAALVWVNLQSIEFAKPSSPIPAAALRPAAAAVHGCILSDDAQTLAALNVLSRDLEQGCPLRPDVTGYTYDVDSVVVGGQELPRTANETWQRDVTHYLLSGRAVIVHRDATGLDRDTSRLVRSGRVLAKHGNWTLHTVR